MSDFKYTVCFDFDGVIHKYSRGWTGYTDIYDEPVDGIYAVLSAVHVHHEVVIQSTRAQTDAGSSAIWRWLAAHHLDQFVDRVTADKPPATVYVDDRAICFDGDAGSLYEKIISFKSWLDE